MLDRFHTTAFGILQKCTRSAQIFIGHTIEEKLLEELKRALDRQLVLDLFLLPETLGEIEQRPFLLNRLLALKANGANIYVSDRFQAPANIEYICQIDFCRTDTISSSNILEEMDDLPYGELFKSAIDVTEEYGSTSGDIKLELKAKEQTVLKGKSTKVHWGVINADDISIEGIGEVASSGKIEVQILEDSYLVIRAARKGQTKRRAILIRAVERVDISYDLQFLNPTSRKFVSLTSEEGVFGVSKGHQVKLIWKVQHAEVVEVQPFGLTKKEGEHVFEPEGTMGINIQARLQSKVTSRRIIVHEFPMPVFSEKLIRIKDDFLSEFHTSFTDYSKRAQEVIDKAKFSNRDKVYEQILERTRTREQLLFRKYSELNFTDFYDNHSINRLNKSILDRLKSYFRDEPKVKEMIELLHNHSDGHE